MNFTPRSIITGTNSDGTTFRLEDWDYATLTNNETFGFLIMFAISSLVASILSPILLVLCIINYDGRIKINNIFGVILGTYVVFDFNNNWLISIIVNIFCDDKVFSLMAAVNIACLITHIIYLIFGGIIYKVITNKTKLVMTSIITIVFFIGLTTIGNNFGNKVLKKQSSIQSNYPHLTNEENAEIDRKNAEGMEESARNSHIVPN